MFFLSEAVTSGNEISSLLMSPVIQYGFAGLCLILLGVVVWLIKQLLVVLKENNIVIHTLTQVINSTKDATEAMRNEIRVELKETRKEYRELKEEIANRPCWAKIKVLEESDEFHISKSDMKKRKTE